MHKIFLRRLNSSDCTERYLEWLTDESNRKFITTLRTINTMNDLRKSTIPRLSNPKYSIVGIFQENNHIGNIQARSISENECIISILIGDKDLRGKGIARNALNHFLNSKALLPIITSTSIKYYAVINENNAASQRLFLSCGFHEQHIENWPKSLEMDKANTKLFILTKGYKN